MSDELIPGTGRTAEELRAVGLGALVPRDVSPLEAQHAAEELERRQKLAEQHGLSLIEVTYCERQRIDLAGYAAMRTVRTVDDYERAKRELAEREEARAEAARQARVERAARELGGDAA